MSMRFLIIRLSSIGDIVHALPAASALAKTFPEAKVDWVVETRHAGLLEGIPLVIRIIPLDTLGWRKRLTSWTALKEAADGIASLREAKYDAAIDFQGLYKSAIIGRLSRSEKRVGFARPWLREPAAGILYNQRVRANGRHVIEINFALVEKLGVRIPWPDQWEFPLPHNERDDRTVESQLASLGAKEFVVMNPGAGWQEKRWPPAQYAELIQRLNSELSMKILLTGSPLEGNLIREILGQAQSDRAHYFPSTLVQLIALLRRARLFVGGDTGPTHLAEAVGTPVVALFNSEDPYNTPERNGPFSPEDITLTPDPSPPRRKGPHYIEGIATDTVLAAIRQRLARAHG